MNDINSPAPEVKAPGTRYPRSFREAGGSAFWMDDVDGERSLLVTKGGGVYERLNGFETEADGREIKICPLTSENAALIREVFPFTAPVSHAGRAVSLGLGDRLGLASPGHIELIRNYDVFPVLAQQSIRELTLTGRTYDDVLDSATWAVFQEGYTGGFGADGDHLKTVEEVRTALARGYSMITLDCSEHIRSDALILDESAVTVLYNLLPAEKREVWESAYLNKSFVVEDGYELSFTKAELELCAVVYGGAIDHTMSVYRECISPCGRNIDFELSIDETPSATSPAAHYFTANEIYRLGAVLRSLAPRFTGEFQKGIDYKGDTDAFAADFTAHVRVARHFGYKISVHSGSDKFAVFPLIGKISGGVFHLKTAGTNWLEALRVVAEKDPALFRQIFQFSLIHLPEAKKYYHITENTANIPDLDTLTDAELPALLDQPDARQALHVCYGVILLDKRDDGEGTLKEQIYKVLRIYRGEYAGALREHIGRHLTALGIKPKVKE